MGAAGWLATVLDQEMVEAGSRAIAARHVEDHELPVRSGSEVAAELKGRFLVRYMLRRQVGAFKAGSSTMHWVTPTPLSTDELPHYLFLPDPIAPRTHAMLLDPARIDEIQGPRWVRAGKGIEYLLPKGFRPEALALPWEIELA
jgi:hypothetical protein